MLRQRELAIKMTTSISRRELLRTGMAGATTLATYPMWLGPARAGNDATAGSFVRRAQAALDRNALIKLAMDLCDIQSRLGHEENLARFYCDRMRDIGFSARLQPFAPNRANAIGVYGGAAGQRRLMFNGHLESHFPTDLAEFPSPKIADGDRLTGIGVWNMKASLAAYLASVAAVRKARIPIAGEIIVAATAGAWDESPVETRLKGDPVQGYGIGTKHMISHGGMADFCVVGEPTSFKLVTQHFGINLARIDVSLEGPNSKLLEEFVLDDFTGTLPNLTISAIDGAAEIVRLLHEWIPDYQRRNELMRVPPPVSICAIEGGIPWAPHIPTSATVFISVGSLPGAPDNIAVTEIRPILAKLQERYPSLNTRIEIHTSNPAPSVSDENSGVLAVEAAHAAIFRRRPERTVVQWYSDASALCQAGIPAVNYGPAGRVTAINESVRLDDLISCAQVYIDLIVRFCGVRS